MSKYDGVTAIVFRTFKKEGDVIALFPELTWSRAGWVQSYQHVGQHAAADYDMVIRASRPATNAEIRPLLEELERIGYFPKVYARRPPR